ncbi:MAG: hypothetical protein AAFP77_12150 [Bacteroidota bacterium]
MRLLLLSLFFICTTSLFAQDRIQLINGEDITGWVLEVGPEIRYQHADFPDGPIYILLRQEVAMIIYSNGRQEFFNVTDATPATANTFALRERYLRVQSRGRFYEGFTLISRGDFEQKLLTVPGVYQDYRFGRNLETGGYVLGGIGLITIAVGFVNGITRDNTSINFRTGTSSNAGSGAGAVGGGLFIVLGGGIIAAVGVGKTRRAVDEYNASLRTEVGFLPVVNENGIGIALQF